MDTIYAPATARGRAGVAIVRISGPNAHAAVETLAVTMPPPRLASLRRLRDADGALIDEALVLVFEAGASFTGEAMAELHLHGSPATIAATLQALSTQEGCRLAEPGEFARRALENDCLDLAQAEGLADLIDAETEAQRRQAVAVLSGAIGERAEDWRSRLVRAAALVEVTIDFADEEVPVDVTPEVLELIGAVRAELAAEAAASHTAERIRDGFEVAIVGAPNVGKSTLLNALAGRDAAITSEVAGTTRDVIEVRMDIDGLPVTVLDTAGIRDTDDHVESLGVARTRDRAERADMRVFLLAESDDALPVAQRDGDISLLGKADLRDTSAPAVSGKTGDGVAELLSRISETLGGRVQRNGVLIRERHRRAVEQAERALGDAESGLRAGMTETEIVAEHLRAALRALDSLVGRVDVEHILDEIFSSFCLGK